MKRKESLEELKKKLIELLAEPYGTPPESFPKEIGVLFYNEEFPSLVDRYELSQKEKKELKDLHSVLKETIDRAIEKKEPIEDQKILTNYFFPKPVIVFSEKEGSWYPYIHFSFEPNNWFNLLIQWIFYVWKGKIKVKRCKAKDCDRIFIPVRSDQEYCSKRCAKRVWAQKHILLER